MTMATASQKRMIWSIARKLNMDDGDLHGMVAGLTGCESIRRLNVSQAARVIDRLNVLSGKSKDIPDRATQRQQNKILALAWAMGWSADPKRLRGFLEKRIGVSDVRFLSMKQAFVIIEAMKAMQAGGRAERQRKEAADERLDE